MSHPVLQEIAPVFINAPFIRLLRKRLLVVCEEFPSR